MKPLTESARRDVMATVAAFALGAMFWLFGAALVQKREAWDDPAYFTWILPTLAVCTGALGYYAPGAWVMIGLAAGAGQFGAMTIGGLGNLWPCGGALTLLLSVPLMATALVGGQIIRRRDRTPPEDIP